MKIDLFFQEITFRTQLPGSNFLLPTFLTGGKWDFEVANLLLLILNPGIIDRHGIYGCRKKLWT